MSPEPTPTLVGINSTESCGPRYAPSLESRFLTRWCGRPGL